MKSFSKHLQTFIYGLLIFVVLMLLFYITNIDGYIILSVYIGIFWIYIIVIDLKYRKRLLLRNDYEDNPTIVELKHFSNIWKSIRNVSQNIGFILLIISFITEVKNVFVMILGTILLFLSLLFDSLYENDTNKINELYYKEK